MLRMDSADHAAIRAVLSGDKDAYGTLVLRHSEKLFRVAYRITGNEADADDVVQEALLRGYRKLEGFQGRADFGSWIYRIAVRCALNKIGSLKAEDIPRGSSTCDTGLFELQWADSAAGPDRLLLSCEIGAMQELAMQSLTPTERTAFVLRHVEECTTEEIAATLGVAPNAAKQAVFRAVQKLRRRLANLRVKI